MRTLRALDSLPLAGAGQGGGEAGAAALPRRRIDSNATSATPQRQAATTMTSVMRVRIAP